MADSIIIDEDTTVVQIDETHVEVLTIGIQGPAGAGLEYTELERDKLAAIAPGATQNASDAALRDRTTHTGVQDISTVTGLQTALNTKVDQTAVSNRLYGTGSGGAQTFLPYASTNPTANSMVYRDSNGRSTIADPNAANQIASKGYVDTTAASSVAGKADDSTVVHLASTESITGLKTFSDLILASNVAPAFAPGKLVFDSAQDALVWFNSDSAIALSVGEESRIRVLNNTASTIPNGAAVYVSGAVGGTVTVALSRSNAVATSHILGLTTEPILIGQTGYVTTEGLVRGLDTSAFTLGAVVYLSSATAGALTATSSTSSTNNVVRVGYVAAVDATNGMVMVSPVALPLYSAQSATADLGVVLSNAGIRASGTAYPISTSGAAALSGTTTVSGVTTLSGNIREPAGAISATATLTTSSAYRQGVTATTAAIDITLPATTTAGIIFKILRRDATAQTVRVLGTIGGATNFTLTAQNKWIEVMSTTTSGVWEIWGNN